VIFFIFFYYDHGYNIYNKHCNIPYKIETVNFDFMGTKNSLIKGQFTQKWAFCHHLLMSFQTCMNYCFFETIKKLLVIIVIVIDIAMCVTVIVVVKCC